MAPACTIAAELSAGTPLAIKVSANVCEAMVAPEVVDAVAAAIRIPDTGANTNVGRFINSSKFIISYCNANDFMIPAIVPVPIRSIDTPTTLLNPNSIIERLSLIFPVTIIHTIAVKSLSGICNIANYDVLVLELITGAVSTNVSSYYKEKVLSSLTTEEIYILKTYFDNEMSLKATAEALFLHKNTIQYRLNRIEDLTGYNPRKFADAVILYMAILLSR